MHCKYKLVLLSFVLSVNAKAQNIHIKLTDSAKSVIELAYLNIFCDNNKLNSYQIIRKSHFTIVGHTGCNNVKIRIESPGYQDYHKELNLINFLNDTLVCVLSPINVKNLQPIIVTAKPLPILIRNDTTTYRVKSFSDGTEQKLSDLLEKLPGIEVNKKSGEIKFKGKPIETILLEGDNLFGANYTLGSKNITANIVTEVQAIENYSENYVLKGLENEEKVALNIKVAKTKLKLSGNSEIGLGSQVNSKSPATDINSNFLGLSNVQKFFSTLSYNNIGNNKAPIDYFGNNPGIEQIKERKYVAQKIIYEPALALGVSKNYGNINSQFFANYNSLFKLTSKITLKGSIYYINDRISNQQNFQNEYYVADDTIKTSDITTRQKKPQSLKADLNLRYAISSMSLLEVSFSDTRDKVESSGTSISNFIPLYQTALRSNERFSKLLASFTQRLTKKQALQIELRKTNSNIDQAYNISPSVLNRTLFLADKQLSRFERNYTQATATLFGLMNNTRYNIYLKGVYDQNKYFSGIVNDSNNAQIVSKINNINYLKKSVTQGSNFNFDLGKLKLTFTYNFTYLQQKWINTALGNELSKNTFLFEPAIKLKYILTKISSLALNYNYSLNNINDQFLFPEIVIQNFRTATNNKPDLSLIGTNTVTLNYSRSDLFNQFDNGIGATFQTNNRDFLPIFIVTDSLLYTTFSMEAVNNKYLDIHTYITKYFPALKSTLRVSLNNTTNFYFNSLSPGLLRRNVFNSTTSVLFFKTVFKGKFNFEAENSFTYNTSKSQLEKTIPNLSYMNNAKIIFIPSKTIKMFLVSDYFLPNINSGKGNLFINYNLSFRPQKSTMELKLIVNNITNTQNFFQYQVSDFSRNYYSINSLPRNILLYVTFQF